MFDAMGRMVQRDVWCDMTFSPTDVMFGPRWEIPCYGGYSATGPTVQRDIWCEGRSVRHDIWYKGMVGLIGTIGPTGQLIQQDNQSNSTIGPTG